MERKVKLRENAYSLARRKMKVLVDKLVFFLNIFISCLARCG